MSVYKKLNDARTAFHKLKLAKTGHNKFAGYKYFELGDFLIPAMETFAAHGLCAYVSFEADIAKMTILDVESPQDQIVITSPMGKAELRGCHEVQNIGAVETYQRRYLWVAALEIVEHDMVDSSEPVKPDRAEKKANIIKPTSGALEELSAAERGKAIDIAEAIETAFASENEYGAYEEWDTIEAGPEFKTAVWSLLGSKVRSTIKRLKAEANQPATVE